MQHACNHTSHCAACVFSFACVRVRTHALSTITRPPFCPLQTDVDEAIFGKTPEGGQMRPVNVKANYFVNQRGEFGVNKGVC